jgi:outer membrane protein assembly factor BamB
MLNFRHVVYVDPQDKTADSGHSQMAGAAPIYAVDAESDGELRRFQSDGRLLTPPAVGNGTLYFVSLTGTAYAID